MPLDHISWHTVWTLTKFKDPNDVISKLLKSGMGLLEAIRLFPDKLIGEVTWDGNVGLNEGIGELIDIICGLGTPTKWDNAGAYLGVGNSATAPLATQTGLQGASKEFVISDVSYPVRSNQTAEWRATYGTTKANFHWQEYTVVNASDDTGKNLNRCISDKGTKTNTESWTLSVRITFS
jgi:hypothetical protein